MRQRGNLGRAIIVGVVLLLIIGARWGEVIAQRTLGGSMEMFLPVLVCGSCAPAATATASATATTGPSATPTATATEGPSPTASPTATASATATEGPSPTATRSPTQGPSATATPTPTSSPTPTPIAQPPILTAWMLNTTGETAAVIRQNGNPVLVNVQGVTQQTTGGVNYVCVGATGIPSYETTMTSDLIDWLNSRPRAMTDFVLGHTTATAGQSVDFGEDIGYASNPSCTLGAGAGYWPPGPACPTNQNRNACFPLGPTAGTGTCETGLGAIGLWVNGTAIFNWADGQSYQNQNIWHNDAAHFEYYDVDICPGHSAMGNYHHHAHPTCLQEQLADTGQAHSPIYGFVADGYPVHGPWVAPDTLAQSCWKPRDYDNAASPTGCGVAGARTCLLVDPLDPSQGTTPAASAGPRTDATVVSMSGNSFLVTSGYYFEDYYFDAACSTQGLPYLDEHNGHEHDGLGYHYHTTRTDNGDGTFSEAFPYFIGPTYAGTLPPGSFARCGGGPPPPPAAPVSPDGHTHDHPHP